MSPTATPAGGPLWAPGAERAAQTGYARFASHLGTSSEGLPEAALADLDGFWGSVWDFCGVVGERGAGPAYAPPGGSDIRGAQFFPGARLNYAENLLLGQRWALPGQPAIISTGEDGQRGEVTWEELRRRVVRLAGALVQWGVRPGDRVAAWLPNRPQAVIAMLAASWVGAVFTSTSPDFGVSGVLDRFSQVRPKVLLAADGYRYAGTAHDRLPLLGEIAAGLPDLQRLLVVPEIAEPGPLRQRLAELALPVPASLFDDAAGPEVDAVRLPFDAAGFILYSSGTTGVPKCIVHRGAGILLKHLTEHRLHCDIRPGDRVLYYTTLGWMMWNWLASALASGATVVLYDGSAFHPGRNVLFDLAEQERLTLFGTSAKYLDAAAKAGLRPTATHDLAQLRTVTSTGSPLAAEGFDFVYRDIKADVHLASISGGTDLCGCFVLGNPTLPVYAGEIQGPALGMACDVWDDAGRSLAARPGTRGELVCPTPFPSMPLQFFGDDGSKYDAAYFQRFPGVWTHGDFASRTGHGGFVIHGRSDATLNAGGVRIGTAEIYRQVEQLPQVLEALAVGQEWDNDTRIVLFLRLQPGADLDAGLLDTIKQRLRSQCSPRHVPARILAVADLPRTRSGKLAELAVADVIAGRPVRNVGALANPESLALFRDLPDLGR